MEDRLEHCVRKDKAKEEQKITSTYIHIIIIYIARDIFSIVRNWFVESGWVGNDATVSINVLIWLEL